VEFVGPGDGQAAAGHRGDAGDAFERRVETLAVAAGRDEFRAREIVPGANIQFQLFEERQQQPTGNEIGQKQLGKVLFTTREPFVSSANTMFTTRVVTAIARYEVGQVPG